MDVAIGFFGFARIGKFCVVIDAFDQCDGITDAHLRVEELVAMSAVQQVVQDRSAAERRLYPQRSQLLRRASCCCIKAIEFRK